MPDVVPAVSGAAVLVFVTFDVLVTALRPGGGGGPLTRYALGSVWRGLLRIHRRDSRSRWLTGVGTALLFGTVLLWSAGLWAGWALIFLGSGSG